MKNYRMLFIGLSCGLLIGLFLAGAAAYSQGEKSAGRRVINLPNRSANAPFSDGVMVGNTLYLAGRLGTDPKSGQIPSDIEQETRFMLDGFKAVLAEAGMTMDDIVSVQIFCSDVALYDKFNGVYRTYFKKDFPARAFLGSGKLLRDAHFEMQAIAVKP
ncbi:MAG TPA: RidA family protein [Blastocatellia bacterium]